MPIEGTITVQGAPAAAATPTPSTFVPSTTTAPHAAEAARPAAPAAGAAPVPAPDKTDPAAGAAPVKTDPAAEESQAWRLAALANKEKAARARADEAKRAEQGLKARQAEIEAREAKLKEAETARQQKMAAYRADPLALLREYGLDYNQVSEFVARGTWTPEQAQALAVRQAHETATSTAQQLEALRKETAEREAALRKELEDKNAANEQAQMRQAVEAYKAELGQFMTSDPETYELSNRDLAAAQAAAYEYAEEQFEKTGKPISNKAAADYVEGRLFEELKKIFEGSKKFGGQPRAPARPTLSNGMRPAPARIEAQAEARAQETEAERRARVVGDIEKIWAARRK